MSPPLHPEGRDPERFRHGGNLRRLADKAKCAPGDILDFSVSVNPLGPPDWLEEEVAAALAEVSCYPDPDSAEVTLAACELYQVWPGEALAGNGASELFTAAVRLAPGTQAVIPVPAYVDLARVCELENLTVRTLAMDPAKNFALDFTALAALIDQPSLVCLTTPNNPTGHTLDAGSIRDLATVRPESLFIVDESFADFAPGLDRLTRKRPGNVLALVSLTKFFSIPGLRLGLAFAAPELMARLKPLLPCWPVNALAQRVGARALKDKDYAERTVRRTAELREALATDLRGLPGIKVFPGQANFLLCQATRVGASAKDLAEGLLGKRIAVRLCDNFEGLDHTFFRVAVKDAAANACLKEALAALSGLKSRPKAKPHTPALMVQGTSSDAGKSVLTAALCRILLQDGYVVAPFKAQNMSLNSFVTADGREIGRAQATQAAACRLAPDARMNPVLLKPGSDTGSQVLILGRPVGNMNVAQYVEYKPTAFAAAKKAYDELAAEAQVMVLEGAGSPAEVNLKQHDIVNMAMAEHAAARVLLVADIDRGGVFASILGTLAIFNAAERARVEGYVLNKFRGDQSLLDPGFAFLQARTGKPCLGVVPWLADMGLPEEDSVSFKAAMGHEAAATSDQVLDIACLDLPRISNFTDLDPLRVEPDVRVRIVRTAAELGRPDAVILPGSKNTLADLAYLRKNGLAQALLDLPASTRVVGICAGLQMLGLYVADPLGLESTQDIADGLGLLHLQTTLAEEKTLRRTSAEHLGLGVAVTGYEIHHGETHALTEEAVPLLRETDGQKGGRDVGRDVGWSSRDGRVWGTYLHGIFDQDAFRRRFLDGLREARGLAPLTEIQAVYSLEPALDRLAEVVRGCLDLGRIYRSLGL